MKRLPTYFSLLTAFALSAFAACSSDNAQFCDSQTPCENSGQVCDLSDNSCINSTKLDAGIQLDAGPVCGGENVCIEVPSEWIGPVALFEADTVAELPDCEGTFPEELATLGGDIVGADTCACECGDMQGLTCGPALISETTQSVAGTCPSFPTNCQSPAICNVEIPPGTLLIPTSHLGKSFTSKKGAVLEGSCEAPTATGTLTSQFQKRARLCQANAIGDSCEQGQACAPSLPEEAGEACIVHTGDIECPENTPYTQKTLFFEGIDDQRQCESTSCSCSEADTCKGDVLMAQNSVVGCFTVDTLSNNFYVWTSNTSSTSCGTSGQAAPSGDLTGVSPTTVCCQPAN